MITKPSDFVGFSQHRSYCVYSYSRCYYAQFKMSHSLPHGSSVCARNDFGRCVFMSTRSTSKFWSPLRQRTFSL